MLSLLKISKSNWKKFKNRNIK